MTQDVSYVLHRDALLSLRRQLHTGHTDDGAPRQGFLDRQIAALDEAIGLAGPPRSSRAMPGLFDLVPIGLAVLDEHGRILDANDAADRLLGYPREELVGTAAADLLRHDDPGPCLTTASGPQPGPRVLVHADGHPVSCEIYIAASVQADGTRLWLILAQDTTNYQQRIEQLQYQASHDELTGLPNRQGLRALLGEQDLQGPSTGFAVLFCDIDNFKRVNDSWGHPAGDELLIAVASRLQAALPPDCHLARFSGDEFLITCPHVDTHGGLEALAARVSGCLRTTVPLGGRLVRISASVGAAAIDGAAHTLEDLVRFADAAMFEAKHSGAGRIAMADTSLIASADRQLDLEDQLREALATDGLTLHYQPVVTRDDTIGMAEALLRWPHPDRGVLGPDVVLSVAEQGDLLRELDLWVLRTALAEAASWSQPIQIAINLSGLPSNDPDLLSTISTIITESGIAPHRVVLELTETALLDLPPAHRQAITGLTDRGVAFAIDDFGTGYSSLARIQDVPAQIIKLDRTFLPTSEEEDTNAGPITQAIVNLCRATGHHCIAEGVETPTQRGLLENLGVEAYQGWLFSPALPAPEFRRALGTNYHTSGYQ